LEQSQLADDHMDSLGDFDQSAANIISDDRLSPLLGNSMFSVISKMGRRWLLGLTIITLLVALLLPGALPGYSQINRSEIRGVWITNIDSDVLFERNRLKNSIDKLKELNFNTLYPVVWNWGYTLYPSKVAAKEVGQAMMPKKSIEMLLNRQLSAKEGLVGRDVLKEIIDQGHKAKMAVIPWFEFGFMTTAPSDPAGSNLAKNHPEWLTQKKDGSKISKEGKHERVWLNPLNPEVQKFIKSLLVEVVKNYDVDGIQLDDHFGYPYQYGYDPLTIKMYKAEHQGKNPPDDAKNVEWTNWRAGKVTAFMKDLFKEVKQANPKAILSVSPNPQEFSKEFFLADWEAWERAGLVEELVIQLYRNDVSRIVWEMQKPEVQKAKAHIPVAIGLLSGLKPRRILMNQIQEQVAAVRKDNFAGVSFFFYETLWNLKPENEKVADRQASFKKLFPTAVSRPRVK
jgi:uncharacterized lipoprotein YddW (UPF0748 family)